MGIVALFLFVFFGFQLFLSFDPEVGVWENGSWREHLICVLGLVSLAASLVVCIVANHYQTQYQSIIDRADWMGKVERTDDGLKWNSYPFKLCITGEASDD